MFFTYHILRYNTLIFLAPSFYGGSEDLSDDITQQQLLPGVK